MTTYGERAVGVASHFIFRELQRHQLENPYRSDWIARRIVDLTADDATREWRSWQADPKKIEAIEELRRSSASRRRRGRRSSAPGSMAARLW